MKVVLRTLTATGLIVTLAAYSAAQDYDRERDIDRRSDEQGRSIGDDGRYDTQRGAFGNQDRSSSFRQGRQQDEFDPAFEQRSGRDRSFGQDEALGRQDSARQDSARQDSARQDSARQASGARSSTSSGAAAQMQQFLRQHDQNDDGYLSRQEIPSNMRSGFADLDRNSDGYLSQSELRQHLEQAGSRSTPVVLTYVWLLDADQGRLQLNDLQQAYDVLNAIDQDGNGELTRQELRQRQRQVASRWIEACLQEHDQNGDNAITWREAQDTHLQQRFDRLDRNSDDRLTRNELLQSMGLSGQEGQSQTGASAAASRGHDEFDAERRR